MVRGTLGLFGLTFLPAAIWLAWRGLERYWPQSLLLLVVGGVFLRLAFTRDEDSWVALIDDLDGPQERQ